MYKLAKYDTILGKGWIEEAAHHIDFGRHILYPRQNTPGSQSKLRLVGLSRSTGRQEWQVLTCSAAARDRQKQMGKGIAAKRSRPLAQLPETVDSMVTFAISYL